MQLLMEERKFEDTKIKPTFILSDAALNLCTMSIASVVYAH